MLLIVMSDMPHTHTELLQKIVDDELFLSIDQPLMRECLINIMRRGEYIE